LDKFTLINWEVFKMVFKGLLNSLNKQNKRRQAMKSAQQIAVGVGVVTLAAASGVATGILLAPKSGKETRDNLIGKGAN
jgi:hypothetical protein